MEEWKWLFQCTLQTRHDVSSGRDAGLNRCLPEADCIEFDVKAFGDDRPCLIGIVSTANLPPTSIGLAFRR